MNIELIKAQRNLYAFVVIMIVLNFVLRHVVKYMLSRGIQ